MNNTNNNKVLELIHTSIISEGGDGDAIWLSKHTPIKYIVPLIEEFNKKNNTGWGLEVKEDHLLWGVNQEWAIITNDPKFYEEQPKYIILRIDY